MNQCLLILLLIAPVVSASPLEKLMTIHQSNLNSKAQSFFDKTSLEITRKAEHLIRAPDEFNLKARVQWMCETLSQQPIILSEKRFVFHSPRRFTKWTPIENDHREIQAWQIEIE